MAGRIHQLNVSQGGVPKLPVDRARLTELGLEGDKHRAPVHGGLDKALCLYSVEHLRQLQAEGHQAFPGALGENVTTEGIDLTALTPGSYLGLGPAAVIQITSYTVPCKNVANAFAGGDFSRISQKLNPGAARLYARVLAIGELRPGDAVRILDEEELRERGLLAGQMI